MRNRRAAGMGDLQVPGRGQRHARGKGGGIARALAVDPGDTKACIGFRQLRNAQPRDRRRIAGGKGRADLRQLVNRVGTGKETMEQQIALVRRHLLDQGRGAGVGIGTHAGDGLSLGLARKPHGAACQEKLFEHIMTPAGK